MTKITTIHGEMDEELLEKRTGTDETDTEVADWIEYWYEGTLVHRSVHVKLKQGVDLLGSAADFN